MTRQRGASRGVNSQKYNQKSKITPSEAPSKTIRQATHLATPTDEELRFPAQESLLANFLQGGEVGLATLRDRAADALAGLQRSFAAVRLQRAARRVLARRRYLENLHALRAQRLQELEEQDKWESVLLRKQRLFQAVEGVQEAAGEWLSARAEQFAVRRDEEAPEWLKGAGQELEQILVQWQQRQEDRLGEEQARQREPEGTPTGVVRQGRRAVDNTTSPAKFDGFGTSVRAGAAIATQKQSGGRQRKLKMAQNAAARDTAAQQSRDAALRAALVESQAYADSVQAEQERVERQVRAEREEARQLAVAIRISIDQTSGSGWQGMMEGDGGIDEQFRELCEAAGVAPEDIYRPIATTGSNHTVEERVFARKCRRAGVTATCGGQREQLRRLHVARARAEVLMRASLGANWRRVAARNLEAARARYSARQWLAKEAQWKAGDGGSGGGGVGD